MKRRFKQGEDQGEVDIRTRASRVCLNRDGSETSFDVVATPGGFALLANGEVFDVTLGHQANDSFEFFVNGQPIPLEYVDERAFHGANGAGGAASGREIRAVMPGRVVRVMVKVGDELNSGDPVLVLEAMKMENEIKASAPGTVQEILAEVGKSVESGGLLVRVNPREALTA